MPGNAQCTTRGQAHLGWPQGDFANWRSDTGVWISADHKPGAPSSGRHDTTPACKHHLAASAGLTRLPRCRPPQAFVAPPGGPEAYTNLYEGWQGAAGVAPHHGCPPLQATNSGIQSTFLQPTPGSGEMHFPSRWPGANNAPHRGSFDSLVPRNGGRASIDVQPRPTAEAFAQVSSSGAAVVHCGAGPKDVVDSSWA